MSKRINLVFQDVFLAVEGDLGFMSFALWGDDGERKKNVRRHIFWKFGRWFCLNGCFGFSLYDV